MGSNFTISVSCHHFGWAFTSSAKSRVDGGRLFDFSHRSETKNHPWDRIPRSRFHTTILGGLFREAENAGLTKVVQNSCFRVSISGRNEKIPLGSNSTRSVSYHHFGWAFAISVKCRVDEGPPIAGKTSFLEFPHRGETKKHPWDQIPQGQFHTTILGGLAFTSSAKSRVDEGRFSTFPIGAKQKNTLGIEFHEVGFIPPFLVGFCKQRKKPG